MSKLAISDRGATRSSARGEVDCPCMSMILYDFDVLSKKNGEFSQQNKFDLKLFFKPNGGYLTDKITPS